jgi:hypothetical protein
MAIRAGQIYLAKNAKLGKAAYPRPCLVLRTSGSDALIAYFSTKFEASLSRDLSILKTDSGFKESGLKDDSYLVGDRDVTVELIFFVHAKLLGELSGELKQRVEDWWGEPLKSR